MEGDEEEQEGETDDAGYEHRHAARDVVALVLERRGDPSDLGGYAGVTQLLGHHVIAQAVDQIGGLLVLGRASRDHGDDRRVAGRVYSSRRDEGDPWLMAQPCRKGADLA